MPILVSRPQQSNTIPVLPHTVWRASEMASCRSAVTSTGYPKLDAELPNGGWPASAMIELLLQQAGMGEMRLLRPALCSIARKRRIALLQPPHLPQIAAWTGWGLPAEGILWLRAQHSADALWAAEQVLRNGSCGALLFWQQQVRPESLRRLHLASQGAETLFWMLRPLVHAQDASPAPLRLALRPTSCGISIDIIKRRGPYRDTPLFVALDDMPALPHATFRASSSTPSTSSAPAHAHMDRRAPAAAIAGINSTALV